MLQTFLTLFAEREKEIKEWLNHYREPLKDPIYASVDLRNAGFKMSPVDTNIFPAGWNNLCHRSRRTAAEKLSVFIAQSYPGTKKIMILPEHHTRNTYYLTNLSQLLEIVELAGFEAKIGNFSPENQESRLELETSEGRKITEHQVERKGDLLIADGWSADLYLLNNDLSGGIPEILKKLDRPLIPAPYGGWHTRIKSDHFHYYQILVTMFCEEFGLDPWLLSAYFDHMDEVDLSSEKSLKMLAEKADALLEKIGKKYAEYGVKDTPFLFIKNESGTYGMGITTVESGKEILEFNRDERKKMSTGKDKVKITKLILQEGVPTVEKLEGHISEPVLYMIASEVIGGFFRIHSERSERENLNTPGMTFSKMCIHDLKKYRNDYDTSITTEAMLPIYTIIAELASIATGYELIGLEYHQKSS